MQEVCGKEQQKGRVNCWEHKQTMNDIEDHEDLQEKERSDPVVEDKRTVIMNLCCVIVILLVVIGLLAQQLALLKKELHRTKQ